MGIKTSIISNADPRILKTLSSLGILELLTHAPTLSWDVEASKPDSRIFQAACKACDVVDIGQGVIMVGDELKALQIYSVQADLGIGSDYRGARAAGLEARLIRRQGDWSDGAVREAEEDLEDVDVVTSLDDVLEEVRQRNRLKGDIQV
ncbi:hypothetical protein BCR39DRAFT_591651 [Naematelia encephala]|uniref:HAD-like domain-containing protein n=1 Tax=Naematelia encephala TaxID=71784 RepID=A0A1Y2AFC6_9TREE|nr:hypothetical protein BCR39DRAFT_591651 [Naematelia encephala]